MISNYDVKIHIFGVGDLAKEFVSFAGFDDKNVTFYSKSDENNLDFKILRGKHNRVYITISEPTLKSKLFYNLVENGVIPDTFIHPSAIIGRRSIIGIGCIIEPNVIISNDVVIGDAVFVNCNTNIGHDSKIGKFSSIMTSVTIGGYCSISDLVYIGSGAILLPKVKIASKILVGAGSVLIKSIHKRGSYFGNPAKKIF